MPSYYYFRRGTAASKRKKMTTVRKSEEMGDGAADLVVAGGVAANTAIRTMLANLCAENDFTLHAPPLNLCSDNAVMIAWAGLERLRLGLVDDLTAPARPRSDAAIVAATASVTKVKSRV